MPCPLPVDVFDGPALAGPPPLGRVAPAEVPEPIFMLTAPGPARAAVETRRTVLVRMGGPARRKP